MNRVIIPASGTGTRLGASIPKQFLELNGEPILKRTISVFQKLDIIDEIIVTVPIGYTQTVVNYGFSKVHHIIDGGTSRASSVYLALQYMPEDTGIVLIHDGVRPFINDELVQAVVSAVKINDAAIACIPVTDTIKETDAIGKITKTPNRNNLWRAQTPQGFTYDLINNAYQQAEKDGILDKITDDAMLVERIGVPVYIVPSTPKNIKITTAEDLIIARAFLEENNKCRK